MQLDCMMVLIESRILPAFVVLAVEALATRLLGDVLCKSLLAICVHA